MVEVVVGVDDGLTCVASGMVTFGLLGSVVDGIGITFGVTGGGIPFGMFGVLLVVLVMVVLTILFVGVGITLKVVPSSAVRVRIGDVVVCVLALSCCSSCKYNN